MNALFRQNRMTAVTGLLGILLLMTGCQSVPTRDPAYAPVLPTIKETPKPTQGAIYVASLDTPVISDVAFFRDIRANRVGDILTIKLVESTTATKTAEITVEQETDFSVTNPTLFGATPSMLAPKLLTDGPLPLGNYLPSPTSDNRYTMGTSLASGKDFDGSGDSNQSNSLTGEITVSVAQVLPNGNLVVQGEKIFTLNRGHEHIRISGIVRPTDIDSDNTVVSTRVANATIVYSGEGEVADASKLGWLARFFVSAFWPF